MNEALKIAALADMDIMEFWELTPYEFSLKVNAYATRRKEAEESQLMIAYLIAAWSRAKKLPDIRDIIQVEEKQEMTPEQMLQQVVKINGMFGGVKIGGETDGSST